MFVQEGGGSQVVSSRKGVKKQSYKGGKAYLLMTPEKAWCAYLFNPQPPQNSVGKSHSCYSAEQPVRREGTEKGGGGKKRLSQEGLAKYRSILW